MQNRTIKDYFRRINKKGLCKKHKPLIYIFLDYFNASSIATAQATVIPTIGLLPAPIKQL